MEELLQVRLCHNLPHCCICGTKPDNHHTRRNINNPPETIIIIIIIITIIIITVIVIINIITRESRKLKHLKPVPYGSHVQASH